MVIGCILAALEGVSVDFVDQGNGIRLIGEKMSPGEGMIYLLRCTASASVDLKRELEDVPPHGIRQGGLLNLRPILEQFLDDVVS